MKLSKLSINKSDFLHSEMLKSIGSNVSGEQFIRNYYKFPLGFLLQNNPQAAEQIYNQVISQKADKGQREYDTYYDSWLYLYSKLANNPNASKHYQTIMKNKTHSGGFSALPNQDPELRVTAMSGICAFFEKDEKTIVETADYICRLHELNKGQGKYYFMTNNEGQLIKDFPIDQERRYVFETQKARPLLYSFPLASVALLNAHTFIQDPKYLEMAKAYSQMILNYDKENDYCGKNAVAMSMMFRATGQNKYLQTANDLSDYISKTIKTEKGYVQSGQILTIDRLPEYAIGLEFCKASQTRELPNVLAQHFEKTLQNNVTNFEKGFEIDLKQ